MALLGFGPISSAPISSPQSRLFSYTVSLTDTTSVSDLFSPSWTIWGATKQTGIGIASVNFSEMSGSTYSEAFITNPNINTQSSIGFFSGMDSTADNNTDQHILSEIQYTVKSINTGVGFTMAAYTPYRLRGEYQVRYAWANE